MTPAQNVGPGKGNGGLNARTVRRVFAKCAVTITAGSPIASAMLTTGKRRGSQSPTAARGKRNGK